MEEDEGGEGGSAGVCGDRGPDGATRRQGLGGTPGGGVGEGRGGDKTLRRRTPPPSIVCSTLHPVTTTPSPSPPPGSM